MSADELIDLAEMQSKIFKALMSGNGSKIPDILLSYSMSIIGPSKAAELFQPTKSAANRPLLKPIYGEKFLGEVQASTVEYLDVFEEHSSASTTKSPSEIEFRKRSNTRSQTKLKTYPSETASKPQTCLNKPLAQPISDKHRQGCI